MIEGKHNSSILASSNQNTKRERSQRKIKEIPQKNAKELPIPGKERKTRSQLKAQLQNVKVPQQSSHKDQLVKELGIKDSNSKTDDMNRGGNKTVKPQAPQMSLLVRMQQNFENEVDADAQMHNDLDIGEKQRSLTDNPNNRIKTNELNLESQCQLYLRAHPKQVDHVGHAAAARRRRYHLHYVHLEYQLRSLEFFQDTDQRCP